MRSELETKSVIFLLMSITLNEQGATNPKEFWWGRLDLWETVIWRSTEKRALYVQWELWMKSETRLPVAIVAREVVEWWRRVIESRNMFRPT